MIKVEKILFLKRVSIFKSLSSHELRMIAEVVTEEEFASGEVLFLEGQLGDCMYLVVSGRVAITTGTPPNIKTLAVFESGDFLGEMGLYDDKPRAATGTAIDNARVLVLRKDDFCTIISEYPEVALGIMKELNQRIRDTNTKLRSFEGRILDKTTQLYSREYFIECVSAEFLQAKKENVSIAFLVATCSLKAANVESNEGFKVTLERFIGDVGRLFALNQRPSDLTARIGEHKVVIMLSEADQNGAVAFKKRIQKDINKIAADFKASNELECDLKFSIFVFPHDSQETEAMMALLDQC